MFHPNFSKAQGKSMYAHIVGPDALAYRYDAIGNLVADAEQGITISWTPYGKVRQVKAHHDSVTVSYRYDAGGNRTEKRVTTLTPLSPGEGAVGEAITTTTRYVRDASGNVMSIYKNDSLSEVPIYGSARLGQYMGKQKQGEGTMGLRRYELTNHLGNVLTVISDKVGMKADSVWATVLSASDYYPFGLEMKGRTWTDSTYRYGFNGKETDIETGYTDYGFRLMDRVTGRFLTPDPLTKKYPELTPYQFASNTPIQAIDLDGLEMIYYATAQRKQYKGLDQALKILAASGIMKELKHEFAAKNTITDIYINARPLAGSTRGETELQYDKDIPFNKNGIALYKVFVEEDLIDTDHKGAQSDRIAEQTLQKGKSVIFAHISTNLLNQAEKDPDAAKEVAFTITHEILKHAMDEKDRSDDVPTGKEHTDFYNDPDFYKNTSTRYSPNYKDIKPDSPAGKYKQRIEKTAKDLGIKRKDK